MHDDVLLISFTTKPHIQNANTVKSQFKEVLDGFINGGGGGGLIPGWAYKRNKKNVSERRDKTYLRNELKLAFHYILS